MNESEFTDLLARYERGQCSPREKEMVEKWLESLNMGGQNAFESERERIEVRNKLRRAVYSTAGIPAERPVRHLTSIFLKAAACILLIVLAGYGVIRYFNYSNEQTYALITSHSGNEVAKVLLSDGSVVWLKPNSALTYPNHFGDGERIVDVRGEALFEVEKNPASPFVVHSGELTTTVLGTSFNIKTIGRHVEVTVLTGRVSLTATSDVEAVVVLPDQKAIYNGLNRKLTKIETPVGRPDADAIISGTEYVMIFNDTRMDEVVRRIEGKFNVSVKMTDARMANCVITADFTGQSLIKTLDIISKALTVTYEKNNNEITLIGKACASD